MQQSKLIHYISRFSKQEIRLFHDFVDSPYFNKHEKTKELFGYIQKAKSWDSPYLDKQKAFAQLFPSQKFDEQQLRTVMSYLVQLIHQYYIQKHKKEETGEQQICLLEVAIQHDQRKLYELSAGKWKKMRTKLPYRDSTYFQQESRFYRQQDAYDLKYGKRASGSYLESAISNFDLFYISEKLRMTCEMLARKQVTGQLYAFSLVNELIQFVHQKSDTFEAVPSVWMYYLIFNMMTKGESRFYFELKKRLPLYSSEFRAQEARDLYTHALNYSIGKINVGASNFQKETFELYQQMLQKGLLYIDGSLPQWDYTNIVSLGCTLQENDWTKAFVIEQKDFLPRAVRENTYTYNLAAFYYAQRSYSQAISLLQQVEFTDVYYNLLTRILLLKIYFETSDWRALDYSIETFRIYLLRNKQLDKKRRKSGISLVKYTRSIAQLYEQQSSISRKELKEKGVNLKKKIKGNLLVINKPWLLEKLSMLLME